jgi:serine/threonine-protein kinase
MAIVYLAHDIKHTRLVALKVLRPELAAAVERERFAREIEIAARLTHPNIVGLFDSGEVDGLTFFVMPYVEGESLRDVLDREGQLAVDQAVRLAGEMAEALHYAHELDLVHRDVKPANVLLQAGHAMVGDFGIAQAVSEARDHLTRTGTSVGTLTYMSPEQLDERAALDSRSDVYSLGCVLYEMLEGEPPFSASSAQAAMAKKLVGELPAASVRSDVPPPLWEVVRRSLAADPEKRFPSADHFAAALKDATTQAAADRYRHRHMIRRVARAAVAFAAVTAVAAGSWWAGSVLSGAEYERLVVLPLANGSGDSREDFYVSGVYEDLVEEMQRAGLRVINPSSARRAAQEAGSMEETAARLGVDAVVEGSVERVGPRVVAELSLADGATGELIWSQAFSRAQSDVIGLIRNMTLRLAEEIGASLEGDAQARLREAAEVDPVLYERLLQGEFEAFKLTREALDEAQRHFERAVAHDSTSQEAWTWLARLWTFRNQQGIVSPDEARARRDSIFALAPSEGLDEDEAVRAAILTWFEWPQGRWAEAEEDYLTALERTPGDATTRAFYSQFLMFMGRQGEAEREAARAAMQAPDDPYVQGLCAQVLLALHRYDEAEASLTWARRFDPDAPFLLAVLRTTYHLQGEHELAMQSWRDSYRVDNDLEALAALEQGYDEGGYHAALRSVAELFEGRRASGEYVTPWQVGTLYTRAELYEEALEYLSLALDEGDGNCPSLVIDPIFDPMRSDPRFEALVARLGFPAP